jgi:hypothetical protein
MKEKSRIEQESLEMTPEGKEALRLFQEALQLDDEKKKLEASLNFIRYLSTLVDKRPILEPYKTPMEEAAGRITEIYWGKSAADILQGRGKLDFGSGTNGNRVFFSKGENENIFMEYPEPGIKGDFDPSDGMWDRYMHHFKSEKVKLT